MDTNKFRASWTVLNNWASGNWERAIKDYFKLDQFVTPAMADGRKWHEKWEQDIIKTKKLPAEFGDKVLAAPVCESKKVVALASWLDFVFKIDCYDIPTLYEFKTGKQSSESYASSMQMPVYAVGATYAGFIIDKAEIYHYDQYLKRVDMSMLWLTDKMLEFAHNWIITLSGEMQTYLLQNKLYERFGSRG